MFKDLALIDMFGRHVRNIDIRAKYVDLQYLFRHI
jgi:hypothetical protein